jgi:hypothetical protein
MDFSNVESGSNEPLRFGVEQNAGIAEDRRLRDDSDRPARVGCIGKVRI